MRSTYVRTQLNCVMGIETLGQNNSILKAFSSEMSLNEDYSNMDAAQLRKMLQQKSLISQKYRTLDAVGGGEEYCYFRTKEDSFKPSKNQGAGLTIEFFEEEASSKGLKRGLDYFISLEDYRTFIDSCKSNLEQEGTGPTQEPARRVER